MIIFRNKRELTFAGVAILILMAMGLGLYFSLQFLIVAMNKALGFAKPEPISVERFNIQGYKDLNL